MIEDLFEIIAPNVGTEIGNDGFVYGNYIEWLELEELEDDIILNLMEYFDIDNDFHKEKEVIIKKLKEFGVPTETAYEFDYEMPEKQKYWYEDDLDWEYYANHTPDISEYYFEIDKIKQILLNKHFNVEVKALYLFRAFVLTENFQKAIVYSKLPNLDEFSSNKKLIEYVEMNFKKQLNTSKGRYKLYKYFTDSKLGEIPGVKIRNLLAHELDMVWIDGEIKYEIDNVIFTIEIEDLISKLKEYCFDIAKK